MTAREREELIDFAIGKLKFFSIKLPETFPDADPPYDGLIITFSSLL